jgi:hypothetical protein
MTTFNVFAYFWHENLAAKRKHSSVELTSLRHILTTSDSSDRQFQVENKHSSVKLNTLGHIWACKSTSLIILGYLTHTQRHNVYTLQRETHYVVPYLDKIWQFLNSHAGILRLEVNLSSCEYANTFLKVVIHLGVAPQLFSPTGKDGKVVPLHSRRCFHEQWPLEAQVLRKETLNQ